MEVTFDLHVHSALSACAEDVMSPRGIVNRAIEKGLNMVALTDHNATANASVFLTLAGDRGLCGVPGMEVTSREDVHLLALFESLGALDDFQHLVDDHLSNDRNPREIFGNQLVYDVRDEIVDIDEQLRQTGTNLPLDGLIEQIHRRGGVALPAHIDRYRNSLLSQMGLIDEDADYDSLELTRHAWRRENHHLGDSMQGFALITGSDAHFLEEVGCTALTIDVESANVYGIIRALDRLCAKD